MKKTIKITGFAEGIYKMIIFYSVIIILAILLKVEVTSDEKSISGIITIIFAFITSLKIEIEETE